MKSEVKIIQTWGNDLMVVNAARCSMGKQKEVIDDKDIKLINYLAKNHHVSCFEHCGVTFWMKIPIYVARQLMRHRSWTFNEISGRYVEFEEDFFTPDYFREQDKDVKQGSKDTAVADNVKEEVDSTYDMALELSYKSYERLLAFGVCREQARGVLPLALNTQLYASCNLRSFVHYMNLRLDGHAQKEIRDVSTQMLELVKETGTFTHSLEAFGIS